ncbi:MAG: Lrp/AsnC family transcriptional regulator [Gammaproteobacteria bacterium]|nr:Lrp/AsnC family transcriptional regulator [Gammaproteobacteria bacterium]
MTQAVRSQQQLHRLLNDFQHSFPVSATPYADMAAQMGITETELLAWLQALQDEGTISRIGAVFRPNRIGVSTLAAMAVPENKLAVIADLISSYPSVNHNYKREHHFNLWFVVTAENQNRLDAILQDMEQRAGLRVLTLPMEKDYHIDLGFPLQLVHRV